MPALIATLGATDANSYVASVAEATAILDSELYARAAWDATTDTLRERALITAARMLDAAIAWEGVRATHTQVMEWPRVSPYRLGYVKYGPHVGDVAFPTTIPHYLPRMQTLLAASLLERMAANQTPGTVNTTGAIKRLKAGNNEIEYRDSVDTFVSGYSIPAEILLMAAPWGVSREGAIDVQLERV